MATMVSVQNLDSSSMERPIDPKGKLPTVSVFKTGFGGCPGVGDFLNNNSRGEYQGWRLKMPVFESEDLDGPVYMVARYFSIN